MSAHEAVRTELSLATVLRSLGVDAKDALVAELRTEGCLKHARLACRGLRDAVDGSLLSLRVKVKAEDEARLHVGQPCLPLHRWPRCSDVTIVVTELPDENWVVGELLALPFSGSPAGIRQGIRRLSIDLSFHDEEEEVAIPPLQLAALLTRLPNLRQVTLRCPLRDGPLEAQHLYDALISLPHLEHLELRCGRILDHVGVLADKLERLTVFGTSPDVATFDAAMVMGISKLQRLRALCVLLLGENEEEANEDLLDGHADTVRLLLGHMPRSVEALKVPRFSIFDPFGHYQFDAEFRLEDGRVISFTVDLHVIVDHLACLAHKVLLPGRALRERTGLVGQHGGSVLERLVLDSVSILQPWDMQDPAFVDLAKVLQGCGTVDVGAMCVHVGLATHEQLVQTVDWFRKPKHLKLGCACSLYLLSVLLRPEGQPPARLDADCQRPASTADTLPPPRTEPKAFMRLVLQRLLDCDVQQGGQASVSGSSGQQVLLLLRGPLVASLYMAPNALNSWVEALLRAAHASAASLAGYMHESTAATEHRPAYWMLPAHTPGVLVECGTEFGAAAVVAKALRVVAIAAEDAGMDTAAADSWIATGLQFVRVPAAAVQDAQRAFVQEHPHSEPRLLEAVITHTISQVLQAAWDGTDGVAPGASERQRLTRVAEMWSHAQGMAAVKRRW